MGINSIWQSTMSFRKFRSKTHDLSRIYWTQQMASDCLNDQLQTKNPSLQSTDAINVSFTNTMHFQTVAETINWLPTYMERNRLHLLVIYTAFLETYLKEVTFYHTASLGHIANIEEKKLPIKLTKVGEASSSPILKSSTVPDMIKFAAELFSINFGTKATEWIKIYKIRCAAAHNGGIATPRFLQEISGTPLSLAPKEYDNIGLTWDELRTAMRHGDDIATMVDSKISSYAIRLMETDQVLREHNSKNSLPNRNKLWEFLFEQYRLYPIKSVDKNHFLIKYYSR